MAKHSFHKHPRRLMRQFFLIGCILAAIAGERLPAQSINQAKPCHLWRNPRISVRVQEHAADTVPEIRVLDVRFEGTTNLALSEQNAIAAEIMDVVDDDRKG